MASKYRFRWFNPKILGAIYLLSIPAYAGIYSLFPESFYLSTSGMDGSFVKDTISLGENMINELNDIGGYDNNISVTVESDKLTITDYNLVLSNAHLNGKILMLEGRIFFYPFRDLTKERVFRGLYDFTASIDFSNTSLSPEDTENGKGPYADTTITVLPFIKEPITIPSLRRFQTKEEEEARALLERQINNHLKKHKIYLGSDSGKLLNTLISNKTGKITKYSSNYIRMFYLSVATITTLGFGDIVPTTDFARLLVSSESIFGIVVIGLFLASLTSRLP